MSKYFSEDSGELKPEYYAKIEPLLSEVDRRYNFEYDLLLKAMPGKRAAYKKAQEDYIEAKKALDRAYGEFMAGDSSFHLAEQKNREKKKIMDDCLKTFRDLADAEDEAAGKEKKKRQISNNLMRLGINSTENPFIEKPEGIPATGYNEEAEQE